MSMFTVSSYEASRHKKPADRLAKAPFSQEVFAAFLNEIANLELAIVITELDVKEYE